MSDTWWIPSGMFPSQEARDHATRIEQAMCENTRPTLLLAWDLAEQLVKRLGLYPPSPRTSGNDWFDYMALNRLTYVGEDETE